MYLLFSSQQFPGKESCWVSVYHVGGGVWMFATQLSFVQHEKTSADRLETTIDFITFE